MFQMMMNELYADMEDVIVVYIDDVMVFTKTDNPKKYAEIEEKVL